MSKFWKKIQWNKKENDNLENQCGMFYQKSDIKMQMINPLKIVIQNVDLKILFEFKRKNIIYYCNK